MGEYYPKYLEKETYRRVLSVAKSYQDDLKKIKIIENDCIMATSKPNNFGVRNNIISDPTFNITQQIEKHTALLRKRTNAVENTLNKFPQEEQKIIKQNIFCGIPLIYCDTQKSERTGKRIRHNFLMLLALELGEAL